MSIRAIRPRFISQISSKLLPPTCFVIVPCVLTTPSGSKMLLLQTLKSVATFDVVQAGSILSQCGTWQIVGQASDLRQYLHTSTGHSGTFSAVHVVCICGDSNERGKHGRTVITSEDLRRWYVKQYSYTGGEGEVPACQQPRALSDQGMCFMQGHVECGRRTGFGTKTEAPRVLHHTSWQSTRLVAG